MNLPIDLIPNTSPPRFRWRQVINTPVGKKTVEHEGLLLPSVEGAVEALVMIAKQLEKEVFALTADNVLLKGVTVTRDESPAPAPTTPVTKKK